MPLYTRNDIKEMCGVNSAYIRMYEKRHKIIFSGDFLDDSLETNKIQIQKWIAAKEKKESNPNQVKEPKPEKEPKPKKSIGYVKKIKQPKIPKVKEIKEPVYAEPIIPIKQPRKGPSEEMSEYAREQNKKALERLELDDKKKQVEYEKKVLDKKLVELEIAKKRGELIPTKLVSSLVSNLGSSFQNNYKNQSNKLLIEIAQKTKMSDKDLAFFKGELVKSINKSHKLAINEAKNNVENIISENSIVEDVE